jgi:hypothetical protein
VLQCNVVEKAAPRVLTTDEHELSKLLSKGKMKAGPIFKTAGAIAYTGTVMMNAQRMRIAEELSGGAGRQGRDEERGTPKAAG